MKLQSHQPEFQKRFDCHSVPKQSEKLTHEAVEQQINAFLAKGGKITPVSNSIATLGYGAVIVGEDSIATPRPKKSCNKNPDLISITNAAKLVHKSHYWVSSRVKAGALTVTQIQKKTGAKLLKRADVIALAQQENGVNNE